MGSTKVTFYIFKENLKPYVFLYTLCISKHSIFFIKKNFISMIKGIIEADILGLDLYGFFS